jgi:hypothetical protein
MSILSKHSDTEEVTMKVKTLVTLTLLTAFLPLAVATQAKDRGYSNLTFQPKSEGAALCWSLLGTVVPVVGTSVAGGEFVLATAGIFVGPSLGYFYGGETARGLKGIAIRGCVATASLLIGAELGLEFDIFGTGDADDDGWAIVGLGAGFVMGHAIYDIAKVKSTVRKHNEKLRARSLGIVPTYSPNSDAAGLALQMTF